jgi:PleD family two-component response regulator
VHSSVMTLRVLLIESKAEDLLFLQEVLREVEQERLLAEWPQIEPYYAATLAEAERTLSTSLPHAILLSAGMEQAGGQQQAGTFGLVQTAAPDVPVILLLEPGQELLATRLMRNGAQDYLFKQQVDCVPLAHALRNAVLRQRLLSAARAASLTDSLTGLPNRAAFLSIAARDRALSEQFGRRWMLWVAEPENLLPFRTRLDEHQRDLTMSQAADQLRGIVTPADLIARIGDHRFAISVFENDLESTEETCARMRSAAAEQRISVGVSIFDPVVPIFEPLRPLPNIDAMLESASADLSRPQSPHAISKVAGAA